VLPLCSSQRKLPPPQRDLISFSFEKLLSPDATATGIDRQILQAIKKLGNAVNRLFTTTVKVP